jgi:D-sedoheptulose 7-phosphate isomerase
MTNIEHLRFAIKLQDQYFTFLDEHNRLFFKLKDIASAVIRAGEIIVNTFRSGNKILICGNGGSAADAQHLAAELVGRFEKERKALPAIALTNDSSILTALGNDYGFETIFSRQVEALGEADDTLVAISTSGNSRNVILAIEAAKSKGLKSVGLLGNDGGKLATCVDMAVTVPHSVTARIQEAHIFIIHYWAHHVEKEILSTHQ